MRKVSLRDRWNYAFDNYMTKGPLALILGLAVMAAVVIFVIALLVNVADVAPDDESVLSPEGVGVRPNIGQLAWMGLMRTLDTGTMGGDTGHPGFLLGMLAVTLGGVFTTSMLIGIMSNALQSKLEELRKGRSRVIENNHVVILGWSPQIFPVISELVAANANQKKPRIVVMGEHDKVAIEEEIKERVGNTKKTKIVCRSGSPIDLNDLDMVNIHNSKAIVILSPESADPDSHVIKTLLAITNNPNRRAEPYHIVAEIRNPRNMEVARMVGRNEAELVLVGDLIARITAQTCRQSGLSVVYQELLDFGGDEIYFKEEPALIGKTFGEAISSYEDTAIIGVRSKDGVKLNPPMDIAINSGDQIIAISEDDDTIKLSNLTDYTINEKAIRNGKATAGQPERTLILGWNWRVPTILNELDNYVPKKSEATVIADVEDGEAVIASNCPQLKNQTITFKQGDTTDRRTLDSLNVPSYNHVILLCSDTLEQQESDARTLVTLLHLRDISDKQGNTFSIVSEMLDMRNRELAEVTRADDFIVGDKIVSLMISQITENKHLNAVFTDLFDPEGSEIYLKPATNYVASGEAVNFYTVVEAAKRRGEVAFGYRLKANAKDAAKSYGVAVNPQKSDMVTFSEEDKIIVLAEE
ncbi:MAG: potassium transporter TrkA [Chloroflexi bacterium]|nr:potassium transporter TrkA [Chloroflexota bacterium]